MSGTSAAAGFVSGAAALAVEGLKKKLGRYPTAQEVKDSLKKPLLKFQVCPILPKATG